MIKSDFMKLYEDLNRLYEAKADTQKLIDFAGQELADRFLKLKYKLKSPENDLYYWIKNKSVEDLASRLDNLEASNRDKVAKSKEVESGAELVGENGVYRVYHITTYEAAKKYGAATKWCITGIKNFGRRYGDEYTQDEGVEFYFFLPKTRSEIVKNLTGTDYASIGRVCYTDNDVDPTLKIKPSELKYEKHALAVYPTGEYEIFNAKDDPVSYIPSAPYANDLTVEGLPDYDVSFAYCSNCGTIGNYDEFGEKCPKCGTEMGFCCECDTYHIGDSNEDGDSFCSECRDSLSISNNKEQKKNEDEESIDDEIISTCTDGHVFVKDLKSGDYDLAKEFSEDGNNTKEDAIKYAQKINENTDFATGVKQVIVTTYRDFGPDGGEGDPNPQVVWKSPELKNVKDSDLEQGDYIDLGDEKMF